MKLSDSNYHLPEIFTFEKERCRDCEERQRSPIPGNNSMACRAHGMQFVRHSHRCDKWHARGTLL